MKHLMFTIFCSFIFASSANAQVYHWKDASGKTVYSDKPPAEQTQIKIETSAAGAGETKTESSANQPTPSQSLADKELEFRKRQQQAKEKSEKEEKARVEADQKKDRCERNQGYLRSLESGQRISTRDEQGEKSFMDDNTRQQEIAKTKKILQECQ